MKYRFITIIIIICCLLLCGCQKNSNNNLQSDNTLQVASTQTFCDGSKLFSERDEQSDYNENGSTIITLNGNSASASTDAVKINGGKITITDEGTYIVRGSLSNGSLIINADASDKLQLVLDGADVTNKTGAALYVLSADKVFVTLNKGTKNSLSNESGFTDIDEDNVDATIFSKQDLTLNGEGSLSISSPLGHGIACKDELVICGGVYSISCASHGFDVNDSFCCSNADVTITSGKDGIHTENTEDTQLGYVYIADGTFNIDAAGDGISASNYLQLENGTFNITTGQGAGNAAKSTSDNWGGFMGKPDPHSHHQVEQEDDSTSIKGIKAQNSILINNGTFNLDCADDGIHSNNSITVNGGSFNIATGDDGFHADEALTITDGSITITESYEGLEALNIKICNGQLTLYANDDGLNAAGGNDSSGTMGMRPDKDGFGPSSSDGGSIEISGGKLYINASGDGIDANGSIEISGGYTIVCGPTHGDTSTLDYDTSALITGGTFIGSGAKGMAQGFSDSKNQGVVAVIVGSQEKGSKITLADSNNNVIISHCPDLSYEIVILSSPDIKKGESYNITIADSTATIKAQ